MQLVHIGILYLTSRNFLALNKFLVLLWKGRRYAILFLRSSVLRRKRFSVGEVIPAWAVPTPIHSLRSTLTVIIADDSD
jgi:hypothetical protein